MLIWKRITGDIVIKKSLAAVTKRMTIIFGGDLRHLSGCSDCGDLSIIVFLWFKQDRKSAGTKHAGAIDGKPD